MRKIPVSATVCGAYRFLFRNIGTIIGTVWLPLVLLAAAVGGIAWLVFPHARPASDAPRLAEEALPALAVIAALFFGGCLAGSMVLARLTQHALGRRTRPTFAYASLDRDVWRIMLSFLIFDVVLTLISVQADGVVQAVLLRSAPPSAALTGAAVSIVAITIAMRALFFVPAVVGVEHRLGIGRSWSLSRRNFSRLVIVAVVIALPAALLAHGARWLAQLVFRQSPGDPATLFFGHRAYAPLVAIVVIAVVQRIINIALIAGASATAYRALVPER